MEAIEKEPPIKLSKLQIRRRKRRVAIENIAAQRRVPIGVAAHIFDCASSAQQTRWRARVSTKEAIAYELRWRK